MVLPPPAPQLMDGRLVMVIGAGTDEREGKGKEEMGQGGGFCRMGGDGWVGGGDSGRGLGVMF